MADFNKAIEINPHGINAYINRAILRKKQGDLEGSLADQNKAIQLTTNTPSFKF